MTKDITLYHQWLPSYNNKCLLPYILNFSPLESNGMQSFSAATMFTQINRRVDISQASIYGY